MQRPGDSMTNSNCQEYMGRSMKRNRENKASYPSLLIIVLLSLVVTLVLSVTMVRTAFADTVTIRPDGVISSGSWTGVTAGNLNDQSDATFATITTTLSTFRVTMANDAAYAGATINSVDIYVRATTTNGAGNAANTEMIDFGADAVSGSPVSVSRAGVYSPYLKSAPTINTPGLVDSLEIVLATTKLQNSEIVSVSDIWVVVDYTPAAGNNQINSCDGCHDQPPVEGATRSGATGAVVGSHSKHAAYACTVCHPNNAVLDHRGAGAGSTAGRIEMLANIQGGTYSLGTSFAQDNDINGTGLGTCSDVACHGGAASVTPQWGSTGGLGCDGCHGAPPNTNAHPEHYAAKGWSNPDVTAANCTACHPDNTAGHTDVTDGSVIVNAGVSPGGVSPAISCGSAPVLGCHNGKSTPNWNTGTPITCTNCHTPGGANTADPLSGLHNITVAGVQKHDSTLTGGCEACHVTKPSTHTDGTFNLNSNNNTDRFVTRANLTWTDAAANTATCSGTGLTGCHSDGGAWSRFWSTDANSTATAVGSARCNVCHGQFGNWRAGTSHGATFGTTTSTRGQSHNSLGGAANACEDCHSYPSISGKHNTATHLITVNQESPPYTVTESGGRAWCQGCHSNDGDFAINGTHTFKQSVFTLETVAGANDPVGSCTGCHGGGTSGASSANYWPDGSNANPENTGGNNKHLVHMTRLAQKRYGETIAQLLTDNTAGNPGITSDTKQKALCDYCHQGSTNDGDHTNTLPAEVFPVGYKKSLWNAADADATYNAGNDTCSNIDCHNSKLTTDGTFGWYDAGTSTCTMCHTVGGAGANPVSGLHNTNAGLMVSGKRHDDTLKPASGCAACHGMPAVAPASTHMNGTFIADSNSNTDRGLTGLYTDAAANSGTCSGGIAGAAGCHDGAGDAGTWMRRWSNTADDGGTAPCANCHGGIAGSAWTFGGDNVAGDGSVSHNRNWDGDGSAEVMANHDSANACNTCHVYPDAPYNGTWGNNHGNDQVDMNSTFGYDQAAWNCTSACHTGGANTNHNLEDSGWNVNPVAGPGLSCTGCHGGGSPAAGVSSTSPHVITTRGGSFNKCEDCHPGGTKGATHSNGGSASVVVILNNASVGINYSHDVDTAGGVQNGFVLGGDATSGTTEAEICWNCHIGLSPMASEWGTNTGGTYNYGSLHSSLADGTASPGNHLNWTSGFWKSGAGFTYKNGALGIRPTHADGSVGSNTRYAGNRASASIHATGGTVGTQSNALNLVRCSYCHDVHNTGGGPNGKPFLRGTWRPSPYKEDGAPRAGVTFSDGSAKPTHGDVPRGHTGTTGNGAYQIDQNNGSPNSTYAYATNDGLCNLCHTQGTLETAWAGHRNSVRGFSNDTATPARNIFSVAARGMQNNRTTRPFMGYQGVTAAQALNSDWMGGFRSSDYAASANSLTTIPVNGRYNYLSGEFNWGTQGTGLTQIDINNGSGVNADYHSFSCSKCHNPHASRLPRLMITNCLDTKLNTWDDQFATDPKWSFWSTDRTNSNQLAYTTSAQNCHRRIDANGDGDTADTGEEAGWNTATPW